jgi:HTH-type transcriptional regulator/antitoxin HipB
MGRIDDIALAVLTHRKEAGLTQKQLADLAGVGKTVVFDIEKGKASIRFDTLMKVLEALSIEIGLDSPLMRRRNEKS